MIDFEPPCTFVFPIFLKEFFLPNFFCLILAQVGLYAQFDLRFLLRLPSADHTRQQRR